MSSIIATFPTGRTRRLCKLGLIHLTVTGLMLMIMAPAAHAATFYLPDLTANGKFNYMTISRFGRIPQADGGFISPTLNAPASYAKLAYDRVPDRVRIYDGGYCNNSDIDTNVNMPCGSTDDKYQVYYDFQALNYETGELGPVKRFTSSQMPVKGFYSADLSDLQSTAPSADGKYFVQMYAHWAYENPSYCNVGNPPPCYGGFNSFLIIMPRTTDLATYPATNISAPPLATYAKGPGSEEFSTITFEFAPKCFATGEALKRPLIWEDADVGEHNQDAPLSWDLYDDTEGRRIGHVSGKHLGGQNERKEVYINYKMNHKYRWVWRGVDDGNGVNFILPFDGYNYHRTCPPPTDEPPPPPPGDPVVTRPTFKVNGGDISAGQGMSIGGSDCSINPNPKAGAVGWNRGAGGGYAGAGTQYAAYVLNHLQEFSTAQGDTTGSFKPSGLSFANNAAANVSPSSGLYGGSFGAVKCTPDYFADATDVQTGKFNLSSLYPASDIANGTSKTLYVDGDLYIDHDIRFSGSYSSLKEIPYFSVVVRGNIFVDRSVSRLDGFYIAQPSSATEGGDLYTCADDSDNIPPFTPALLNRDLKATCSTSLTFNGAVTAKRLWLLRTGGDVNTTAAETFNYTPEMWLSSKPGAVAPTVGSYDSITSLPPVL